MNQSIICPICNGSGCDNCNHSGQIQASPEELQQLQALMIPPSADPRQSLLTPYLQTQNSKNRPQNKTLPGSRITVRQVKTTSAGISTLVLLLILAAGAYFSYRYFDSYQPYLATVLTVIILFLSLFVGKQKLFSYQEPNDFLKFAPKVHLQKRSPIK